jgi:hypothetical protein
MDANLLLFGTRARADEALQKRAKGTLQDEDNWDDQWFEVPVPSSKMDAEKAFTPIFRCFFTAPCGRPHCLMQMVTYLVIESMSNLVIPK